MSCLTRDMQNQISRYLKRHSASNYNEGPESIRYMLMNKGLCTSDVTVDQVEVIMEMMGQR